ncbi:hypothetical protein FLONG3_486 [Fusarium longipes]|uniref:Uncharacterized protein n=1 Tax=Fusarium longipes TaxID=694270 RepID=A0A395TAK5_9HYPO|nr:hypothetical protein FLONG3_486 [Fusarium longipes]
MSLIMIISIIFTLFGTLASCGSKFIDPPNADPEKANYDNNRRYVVGEKVKVKWETDLDNFALYLLQSPSRDDEYRFLGSSLTEWEAVYDILEKAENGEDAMYYFDIYDRNKMRTVVSSEWFNVTAPKPEKTKIVIGPGSTVTVSQAISASQNTILTESTTIDPEARRTLVMDEGTESSSESGMSRGEMAGAGVGGAIGGILIIGGFGWLIWRRVAKGKVNKDIPVVVQQQEQVAVPKAELPGDCKACPSNYATSPTGLYEAP